MAKRIIIGVLCILLLFTACGSKDPASLQQQGEQYLQETDYEKAVKAFTDLIEADPENPRGYTGAAEAHHGLGDDEAATQILLDGLMKAAPLTDLFSMLEEMYGQYEDPAAAAQREMDALRRFPGSVPSEERESSPAAEEPSEEAEAVPEAEGATLSLPENVHPAEEEMLAVLAFGREYPFPAFASVEAMDYTAPNVSSNLYQLTISRNEELLAQGSGVSPEQNAELEAARAGQYYANVVRKADMDKVGRELFGDAFTFPDGLTCPEISPYAEGSEFYHWDYGRGGMDHFQYFLLTAEEADGVITASILPARPSFSWDDGSVTSIQFMKPDGELANNTGSFAFPDGVAPEGDFWPYFRLRVPQEELGTITVTFERAADGRLVATSSVYN